MSILTNWMDILQVNDVFDRDGVHLLSARRAHITQTHARPKREEVVEAAMKDPTPLRGQLARF